MVLVKLVRMVQLQVRLVQMLRLQRPLLAHLDVLLPSFTVPRIARMLSGARSSAASQLIPNPQENVGTTNGAWSGGVGQSSLAVTRKRTTSQGASPSCLVVVVVGWASLGVQAVRVPSFQAFSRSRLTSLAYSPNPACSLGAMGIAASSGATVGVLAKEDANLVHLQSVMTGNRGLDLRQLTYQNYQSPSFPSCQDCQSLLNYRNRLAFPSLLVHHQTMIQTSQMMTRTTIPTMILTTIQMMILKMMTRLKTLSHVMKRT